MGLYDDLTLQNSQYIPQYTGLPLDTARDVADTLAERHYQNLARMDQLALLAQQQKTQVLPGHEGYVDEQIGNIRAAFEDIAKNGGENATARVAAIANKYMGDETILKSLQRRSEVQKELDVEAQLRAQGKTPVRRQGLRERYMSGNLTPEELSTPYQSTAEAFISPTPEMEEIWRVVNPDSWYTNLRPDEQTKLSKLIGEGRISPEMDMPLFFKTLRGSGISTEKIEQMLDKAYSSYRNQPSYRQQTGLIGKGDNDLKQEMLKHGLLRVFSQVSPQYIQNSTADDIMRASLKQPAALPYEYGQGETIKNFFPYNADDFDPDKKLSVFERGVLVAPANFTPNSQKDQERLTDQFVADAKTAAEIYGINLPEDAKSWTAEERKAAIEAVKKYQGLVGERISSPYRAPYDAETAATRSKEVRLQITGRTLYDLDSGEKIPVKDNKGWNEQFGSSVADPDKFMVTGRVSPKNPYTYKAGPEFANAEYAQVWDPKNSVFKNYLVTPAAGELESAKGNIDRNTSIVYSAVNLKPGAWADVKPSIYAPGARVVDLPPVKARELVGAQKSNTIAKLPAEQQAAAAAAPMLIEATIDGQSMYFSSPEHLSQFLLSR